MNELNIWSSEKILVLAPHPDDESIWCGGLLLKYPNQCDVVVLTNGCYGGLPWESMNSVVATRKKELIAAMRFCGVKSYQFLWIEDGKLNENFSLFAHLKIDQYDTIFIPAPEDDHIDHSCVYGFLSRMKHNARIFWYEVWSTLNKPSHYLNISDIEWKKRALINIHQSQTSQVDYASKILGLNCYRGMLVYPAISYAEAYMKL